MSYEDDYDHEKDNPRLVDDLLSRELLQLSMKDRNDIHEEIHGVYNMAKEETPEMLKESLRLLVIEVNENIPSYQKRAYLQSQSLTKPTYINDDDFRLRFLRCELFDISKAAKRMVKFIDLILEHFGSYALERPIRISDFTKVELQAFRKGRYQFLPFRDRSGRRILMIIPGEDMVKIPPEIKSKITLYISWASGYEVDSQRKGIVVLVWFDKNFKIVDVSKPTPVRTKFHQVAVVRVSAIHCCTPDTPLHRFRRSIMTMRIAHNRQKLKVHLGEQTELQYILQGYGIPTDIIPVTFSGSIKVTYMRQWIRTRQFMDEPSFNMKGSSIVECPYLNDIIFRKGTSVMSHPGNAILRSLIEVKENATNGNGKTACKTKTRVFVSEIMEEIKQNNGRYLTWDDNGWWTILEDEEQIRSKIDYIVREKRNSIRARMNNSQTNKSGTSIFQSQDGSSSKRQKCNGDNGDGVNAKACFTECFGMKFNDLPA